MAVSVSRRKMMLNVRYAYPGVLGGGWPEPPNGYAFVTDDNGVYLTDDNGNYLVVELV